MQELLIATGNQGKFREIMEVLGDLPCKFVFLGDLGLGYEDFVEDGDTFIENARKKAFYFSEKTGMTALAEDSGILVEALKGELGVKTRRWGAGENASDEEWIDFFMKRMTGVENRSAKFVCSACLAGEDIEGFFQGETKGKITERLMAPILPGLPLSSCFLPEGYGEVYAGLDSREKNKISHRGKTMRSVKKYLEGLI